MGKKIKLLGNVCVSKIQIELDSNKLGGIRSNPMGVVYFRTILNYNMFKAIHSEIKIHTSEKIEIYG